MHIGATVLTADQVHEGWQTVNIGKQFVIIALINSRLSHDSARFFSSEISGGLRRYRAEVTINFINFDLNFHSKCTCFNY